MIRFLRQKKRTNSTPCTSSSQSLESSSPESIDSDFGRRFSTPEVDMNVPLNVRTADEYDLSPTSSIPLSESNTLLEDKAHRLELQETFNENFDNYLPFVLRRMRIQAYNEETPLPDSVVDLENDDQPTILDEPIGDPATATQILGQSTSNFNLKRKYIIASELIKGSNYVFPSEKSFELFKERRSNTKKHRKSSVTIYDESGNVKVLKNSRKMSLPLSEIVDPRNHLIPLTDKIKGLGLPIFKISAPYISNFKSNSPFVVFHRYREHPTPPSFTQTGELIDEPFETYQFCSVYVKKFPEVKRLTFNFTPNDGDEQQSLKLVVFQHCYLPFADFVYKGTRFRIVGTPIISPYALTYNPSLKLLIVDQDKPSLCDDVINRKPGFDLSSILKKNKTEPADEVDYSKVDPSEYPNPHPNPYNPLMRDSFGVLYSGFGYVITKDYIPDNLPPFGGFKDSIIYKEKLNVIPKRYTEVGMVELYQDNRSSAIYPDNINDRFDSNSTKSIDIDNLVLTCVLLTMREASIRATARPSTSSIAISSRLTGFRTGGPSLSNAMMDWPI